MASSAAVPVVSRSIRGLQGGGGASNATTALLLACPQAPPSFGGLSFFYGILCILFSAAVGGAGYFFYLRTRQRIGVDKVWRVDFNEVLRVKLIGKPR